eukprot:jgi/Tetstr1/463881/TSEL_008692.t1
MPAPAMPGLMQDWSLTCTRILDHAARNHPTREIVSRSVEGPIHRTTYAGMRRRALTVAKRLSRYGLSEGDRVATLAWNTWRHMEVWYGLLGIGAIYHTVNPRLFPQQIAWIINHAEDRLLFVDLTFVPIVEKIWDELTSVEHVIVLSDAANMPETGFPASPYEEWLAEADDDFAWVELDENAAAGMCYTSGTTGNPKGVLYSHRSNVLHAMAAATPDMLGLSARDRVMPVVPLFHANGWSLAFSCPLAGAAMMMPGPRMDGEALWELLDTERVTLTAAVPTIWLMLLQYLEKSGKTLPHLERVVIGGAACPRAITKAFEENYDEKQGHTPFTVEMKITDDEGNERPWDGKTFGRLKITDRAKDVIKSGGEWISTIDLENLALLHPHVAEAAVIGVAHPKWDERPLLIVVPRENCTPDASAYSRLLRGAHRQMVDAQ